MFYSEKLFDVSKSSYGDDEDKCFKMHVNSWIKLLHKLKGGKAIFENLIYILNMYA